MRPYIKNLCISGYKRFKDFSIKFQPELNILIGENSVGKSTILEAINIVLNQFYFGENNEGFQQQLNMDNVQQFKNLSSPRIEDLPSIKIEIELSLDDQPINQKFCGLNYDLLPKSKANEMKYGIQFVFEFDKEYEPDFNEIDFSMKENHAIPIEYYNATWTTFAGRTYHRIMNPLSSILIDSSINTRDIYGNYARTLYNTALEENDRRKVSFVFTDALRQALSMQNEVLDLGDNRNFAVDEQKSKLKNLIEIRENGIFLRNMGKGEENILKTSLSLNRRSNLGLIMIEEPENHLSYSNTRKQIDKIQSENDNGKQIIVTTHESMILNRLNLSKAIWIKSTEGQSLGDLPKEDVQYFERVDDFDILRYVLGNKIILVEGASEFILLPSIIKRVLGRSADDRGINIISTRGIRYRHFKELADIVHKRTLILTDNDGMQEKIDEISKIDSKNFKVFTPQSIDAFTLEVDIYQNNIELCEKIIGKMTAGILRSTHYKDHDRLPLVLAAMLARKTEIALKLSDVIEKGEKFNTPSYVEEGLKWLDS